MHNVHEYSKENSDKLSSLAFELAIRYVDFVTIIKRCRTFQIRILDSAIKDITFHYRRRQEAASKARSLNLEIQISQVSKSPKKSIILKENLSNDASSTSDSTSNNTTTAITGIIPILSFNIIKISYLFN